MIVLLLGILDLIAAFSVLGIYFGFMSFLKLYIFIIIYLGIKSFAFRGDFASILDGGCAAFIAFMLFGFKPVFAWLVFLYLLQKGLFSLKL